MLGVIHRCAIGLGPAHFREFFIREDPVVVQRTRFSQRRHNKQLKDPREARFSEQLRRSALGLISVCNLLPQGVVDCPTVSAFQCVLQSMLKDFAAAERPGWEELFSPRVPLYNHLLR